MKIRDGFVSNSSSSSFVCKITMGIEEIKEKLVAILDFHNSMYNTDLQFDDVFDEPFLCDNEHKEYIKDCWRDCDSVPEIGQPIINSASDNSIPYEFFDMIERIFNASRVHLG